MNGVDSFVTKNFGEHDSTFDSCMQVIVNGYSLLEKTVKYSRSQILATTGKVRSKKAKRVELEDYLRNDLVEKYINPYRADFSLDNFMFISGAEEFENNIKTGILDIKVCSPTLDGTVYYVFECKRMNKTIENNYITEGVSRFISGQYYPHSDVTIAGLISFLETDSETNKILISTSFKTYTDLFKRHETNLEIIKPLKKHRLISPIHQYINDFSFVYTSSHKRKKGKSPIDLYHVVLDYNHLVVA
jgi:hypothetical protein